MDIWCWLLRFLDGSRTQAMPEDVRYYETQYQRTMEDTATDEANAFQSGMKTGTRFPKP